LKQSEALFSVFLQFNSILGMYRIYISEIRPEPDIRWCIRRKPKPG